MKKCIVIVISAFTSLALISQTHAAQTPPVIVVNGHTPGPTPFISLIDLTASEVTNLKSIAFTVVPKPSSVTRPVSASYSSAYLQNRGYLNLQTGQITLPVFGLYANYANEVALTYTKSMP